MPLYAFKACLPKRQKERYGWDKKHPATGKGSRDARIGTQDGLWPYLFWANIPFFFIQFDFCCDKVIWLLWWIRWIKLLRINADVGSTDYKKIYCQNLSILKLSILLLASFQCRQMIVSPLTDVYFCEHFVHFCNYFVCYCDILVCFCDFLKSFVWSSQRWLAPSLFRSSSNIWAISRRQNWIQDWKLGEVKPGHGSRMITMEILRGRKWKWIRNMGKVKVKRWSPTTEVNLSQWKRRRKSESELIIWRKWIGEARLRK